MGMIDQKKITDFVSSVEKKRRYKKEFNYLFRHLISEVAELDMAVHFFEKWGDTVPGVQRKEQMIQDIGSEIIDILCITVYISDIYGIDINSVFLRRIQEIKKKYNV